MLLGLVPEGIKALSKGEHRVLEVGKALSKGKRSVRDRPRIQNGPDSRRARPRPRAYGRNRRPPQVVVHPVCPS